MKYIYIIIIFFIACVHDNGLLPYTEKGLDKASYIVNDVPYRITQVSYGDNMFFSYRSKLKILDGVLTFKNKDEGIYFSLENIDVEVGEWKLNSVNNFGQYIDDKNNKYVATDGYFKIKFIDTSNKNMRILSGEFYFNCYNSKLNKWLEISHGNFDTHYVFYK